MNASLNYSQDKKKILDPVSLYKPTDAVRQVTVMVTKDYQHGWDIATRNRTEFNDRSVLGEVDVNQMAFNSYVPPRSTDPDESWRAQTVRPITRNKLISIAAHTTAAILYPNIFAQNDKDESDKDAALVMKDIVEWVIDNSNYSRTFVLAVISALVDPAVIVHVEFAEVLRTVKEMKADGSWIKKEIIDEILSGFMMNIVPIKELLIANIYEENIQKQRFLIRHKYVDYEEAKQVWGKHPDFIYVRPGMRCVFDPVTNTFYDVKDDELQDYLVHEVTYYNRSQDLQLTFVGGIIMCDPEYPNQRIDKLYPFAKGGFEPINNGKFFYYKSAANKLGSDQDIVDTLYNMIIDGTFLALMPPMALYGSEDIDASVTVPGTITSFKDANTKLESLAPKVDLRGGLETIQKVESSMSESTIDDLQSGVSGGSSRKTAREVLLLEQNAKLAQGLFGKMVGFLVEDISKLMIGDILQHMMVGQVGEITDEIKFTSFILPDKIVDGKKVTKKIQFATDIYKTEKPTMNDYRNKSYDILDKEGGPGGEQKIYMVNPEISRKLKYKVRVSVDELQPKSKALEKALNLEAYDRAIQNPVADQEAVTRDFLFEVYRPGESDKYVRKQQGLPATGGAATPFMQKGVNSNLVSQITGNNSLGVAASSDMQTGTTK